MFVRRLPSASLSLSCPTILSLFSPSSLRLITTAKESSRKPQQLQEGRGQGQQMYYRLLGNTGLQVSVLSYGAMTSSSPLQPLFVSFSVEDSGHHLVPKMI